ncbi:MULTISPECIES: phosphate signaling complex protein PhoU [Niveibacterium]|uniref:Phosphate-specific transport system accessory protein PhoU n=1 Tax=Niveibacterium microcysteis TaxID=2811415 RepID=A0ABX7M8U4_9RHOO|nr:MULTISPECIES: phosphate signaling complex protein PhoU [Niveibacterium]QSI77834.1 phosphate signaling complex protein PhoU [Niveibacterium microcysteis]
MTEHTSKQFDLELESIRTRVMQMGGLVEQQISRAIEGLIDGNQDLIERVIEDDHRVNALEMDLDEACSQVIAKRQPAAIDLRLIFAVLKAITDLERIGDEAKKIAKMAKAIHGGALAVPRVQLSHMSEMAINELRQALDAFARLDTDAADEVVRSDKLIDAEFKGVMRQVITFMMEDPRTISGGIDIIFVAKALERIGDHAKNMAQYVFYMARGEDVRHVKSVAG